MNGNTSTGTEVINDINAASMKYIQSCSSQKSPRNLIMAKKYLKDNNLVAVPFDKGVGFCVMKEQKYKDKLNDILKLDQFKKETNPRSNSKDLILREEERVNGVLSQLKEDNKISEEMYTKLVSRGGQPPRLYGLAKVHKQTVPVRPVLSMPGTPYEKVGTWVIIYPVITNQMYQ